MRRAPRPARRSPLAAALALALALTLPLTACAPGGEPDAPDAAGLSLPDIEELFATPVHWESGVLEVFDDVAAMAPEIEELRAGIAAQDAAFGEALLAGIDAPQTLAPSGTFPRPALSPAGGARPGAAGTARTPDLPDTAGLSSNYMLGATATMGLEELTLDNYIDRLQVGEKHVTGDERGGITIGKTDERNLSLEYSTEHQEVKNETIVKTQLRFKMEGTMCPAPDGKFDVRFEVEQNVTATTRTGEASEFQKLIANATGRLGENAIPEQYDMETVQSTVKRYPDGRSGHTTSSKARSDLNFRAMDESASTVAGQGGEFSQAELDALTRQGDSRALALVLGQMHALFKLWLMGGCVQIEHDAPTRVDAGSTTDITVETRQRTTKAEVRSDVELSLSGEKSIDPTELVSTGGFHFEAGDPDTVATITIKAASRQGGDEKKITIEVGAGAWIAIGGTDGHLLTEADHMVICDLTTFGVIRPGSTATNMVGWAFADSGETTFHVQRGMGYSLVRIGTWEVVTDEDGRPRAIEMHYSEGHEIVVDQSVRDLGGGSGHFDLKPIPRPDGCG